MEQHELIFRRNMMKIVLLSLITGFAVGFIFALFKLPIPAPPALAGVVGIIGIYLGFKAFEQVVPWFESFLK
jgi:XapX domain-containing protein